MSDALIYEKDGRVVTLTLNRPDTRNALSSEDVYAAFENSMLKISRDFDISCVILTGKDPAFSSGGNVKMMYDRAKESRERPAATRHHYRDGIHRIPRAFNLLEVPVIAAVNGPAIGAGCDLSMMCDIRIASDKAFFAESFVKVGLIPGDGGSWLLPRTVGRSRAAEMTFTGDQIDAQTAAQWGLVSRVVPHDKLMDEARALAKRIVVNPPATLRMTKRLLKMAEFQRMDEALETAGMMQALSQTLFDHEEAARAFTEKRKPVFKGN